MDSQSQEKSDSEAQLHDAFLLANTKVQPNWTPKGEAFWYRRQSSRMKSQFLWVDIPSKSKRPAFDHERLAIELAEATAEQVDPEALPFKWIDTDSSGSTIRFRYKEQVWKYSSDGLSRSSGEIDDLRLKPNMENTTSANGERQTSVVFFNRLDEELLLYWIDYNTEPRSYGGLPHGRRTKQSTWESHVWRVDRADGQVLGYFRAKRDESEIVIDKCSLKAASSTTTIEAEPEKQDEQVKKESDRVFIRDHNVWLRRSDDTEAKLSNNGKEETPYADTVYMCPNKFFAVIWQYTPEEDHPLHLIELSPKDQLQPKIKTRQYLKAGDRVRIDRPRLFDLEKVCEVPTEDALFNNPYEIRDMGWIEIECGKDFEYQFLYNERGHQRMRLIGVRTDGTVRTVFEEHYETFCDYSRKLICWQLRETQRLVWASESDGRNHLYLFDREFGTLKNQITKGGYIVRDIGRVDEHRQRIWFSAYALNPGEDVYYQHLACINFDGSDLTILTEGDGTHSWTWSSKLDSFVDTCSTVALAPTSVLRDAVTGTQLLALETGSVDPLLSLGWMPPERLSFPGRDGSTPITGILIKPAAFDQNKSYPVIEHIYAGPHDFHVPAHFSLLSEQHALADAGFILVLIDGMGTNWRHKAFHDVCCKDLRDHGFPDRIAWLRAAAASRPWMDISRVGIYGASAGGQSAMAALLWHHDFYRAAVADSGCHDNRVDKLWWNEAWMGWPVDAAYAASSNVVHAGLLQGKLMLMVAGLDENVDPSCTWQVVQKLNECGKEYDLVVFPGGAHCEGTSSAYGKRRIKMFFEGHLLREEDGVGERRM